MMIKDEICFQRQDLKHLLSRQLFRAMCDTNRVTILCHLTEHCVPLSVGQIAKIMPVDVSVVSRHLSMLRDANILIARRQGKEVYYTVNTHNLILTLRAIADAFEACCPNECLMKRDQKVEVELHGKR